MQLSRRQVQSLTATSEVALTHRQPSVLVLGIGRALSLGCPELPKSTDAEAPYLHIACTNPFRYFASALDYL